MRYVWLIESAVALVAAAQAVRIASKPTVRRELREHPRQLVPIVAAAAACAALLFWAALARPTVRHALAALVAAGLAAAWWRARPSYGRYRRLPPGSLGLGQSLDAIIDRRFYLDQAARFGPVFKMSQFGRPVVCIVGLARGRALLTTHAESLASASLPYNRLVPRGMLRYMHSEEHKAVAPLFREAFAGIALERCEPSIRTTYRRALERLATDSMSVEAGVRARPYFEQAITEALGQLFFGLDPDDARLDDLRRLVPALALARAGGPRWRRQVLAALASATALLRDIQRTGADRSTDEAPSALRALLRAAPDALDEPSIVGNFVLTFRLAISDLTGLHDWIFKQLSDHRDALDPVRRDTARESAPRAEPDPAACIVMETLRLEQSEFLYRTVIRPIEFEGMVLPRRWLVRLCVQESHRDPGVFPDPDRFDPGRFARRAYSRTEYSPFGADAHGCMGSRLSLFLGRLFVQELAQGVTWRVVSDGPFDRGTRHRQHWAPSPQFRVRMGVRS
jgi:cytochrome P450